MELMFCRGIVELFHGHQDGFSVIELFHKFQMK
jgi:hypothetical protein